jgi:hypothetical protein
MRSLLLSLGVAAGLFGLTGEASAHGPKYYGGTPVVVRPAYPTYSGYYAPHAGYPRPYYGGVGYPGYTRPAYYGGYGGYARPYYSGFGYPGYGYGYSGFGQSAVGYPGSGFSFGFSTFR